MLILSPIGISNRLWKLYSYLCTLEIKEKEYWDSCIIRGGLCFTLPLILPDLPKDHPEACILNSSQLAYENDPKFQEDCDQMTMKLLYEHQQKQHEDLVEAIDHIPEEFHSLPFHYWGTETFTIQSLTDEARDLLVIG